MDELIRENIGPVMCGNCKWFKVNADQDWVESICKRLDHKKYKFAEPWFKSYDCGQFHQQICRDFEPNNVYKYLKFHWSCFDDFVGEINEKETVSLILNNDKSVRYHVRYQDFVDNTFIDERGGLKWVERLYYKKCKKSDKNSLGIKLVHELNL